MRARGSGAEGNCAVMEKDTMPVVVLFVPCAMFMRVYQDGAGGHKSPTWPAAAAAPLLASGGAAGCSAAASFFLHTGTAADVASGTHPALTMPSQLLQKQTCLV